MKYDTAYDTKLLAIVRAYYILNNHKTYGNIAIVKQIKAVRQEVMIMKDVRSEVFNALEAIMVKTGASKDDMNAALEWFQLHIDSVDDE